MTFSGDIGMRNCIQNVPRVPAQFLNDWGRTRCRVVNRSLYSTAPAARSAPGGWPGPRPLLALQHDPAGGDGDRGHARAHRVRPQSRRPRGDGHSRPQPPQLDLRRAGDALPRRARKRRARPHRGRDLRQRSRGGEAGWFDEEVEPRKPISLTSPRSRRCRGWRRRSSRHGRESEVEGSP
jgi:hypothetical protein